MCFAQPPGRDVQMPVRALQVAGRGELRSHGTCGPKKHVWPKRTQPRLEYATRDIP